METQKLKITEPENASEAERRPDDFDTQGLAANPEAGDVIPRNGGCRKIRWSKLGTGKRGGVRVVYFTKLASGEIWLLVIYSKAVKEIIPAHILKQIREVLENE